MPDVTVFLINPSNVTRLLTMPLTAALNAPNPSEFYGRKNRFAQPHSVAVERAQHWD